MTFLMQEHPAHAMDRLLADRRTWEERPTLRRQYGDWYARIARALDGRSLRGVLELGSGPGLSAEFLPAAWLSDIVQAPWLDLVADGSRIPVKTNSLDGIVAFDVLHHMSDPLDLFRESERCLRPGGRLVLCEPHVSWLSYPVYRWLHHEGLDFGVDPLHPWDGRGKEPFEGNQALPRMLLYPLHSAVAEAAPGLRVVERRRLAGPTYPLSGGFTHRQWVPDWLWSGLSGVERILPEWAFGLIGFRMIVVIEKVAPSESGQ